MSTVNQIALAVLVGSGVVLAFEFIRWLYIDQRDKAEQRRYEAAVADLNAERARRERDHDHGDWSRPE